MSSLLCCHISQVWFDPYLETLVLWHCSALEKLSESWQSDMALQRPLLSPVTHPHCVCVCVDSGGSTLCRSASNLWVDSELSAASQANAKTNLVIISGNPAHYCLLNYPINSTSWESLFATQANVCSQIS